MPRLALSLPAELGPGRPSRSGTAHREESIIEHRSTDRSAPDDTAVDRPRIERWFSCWATAFDRP